jgi:enoyl-CoA hydratase/carnithine racemase
MTAPDTMRLDVTGAVARLTLDRPHVLNAGNRRWVADLNEAVRRLQQEPDVRVVVVTGAGRAFSTGVDLKELAAGEFGLADFVAWEDAMIAIERMDRLFIAGINGHCLGGGLQLTLVCDYRLASGDALLGLPAVRECLIPSCALYRLPRLIGAARARERILLGEPIAAREAERYGLVNRVVPAAEFSDALDGTLERFLALAPHQRPRQQAPDRARLRHGPRRLSRRGAGPLRGLSGLRGAPPGDGRPPEPSPGLIVGPPARRRGPGNATPPRRVDRAGDARSEKVVRGVLHALEWEAEMATAFRAIDR